MKWPLVPRSMHEEVIADLKATIADLQARLNAEAHDRRKLTRTVVRMKVAGGSIPLRRPTDGGHAPRLEQRERDEFEKAVDANPHCQNNPRLRRQQLKWARDQMEKDPAKKDEILDQLSGWHLIDSDADDDDEHDTDAEEIDDLVDVI